jgi:hypothetical protein
MRGAPPPSSANTAPATQPAAQRPIRPPLPSEDGFMNTQGKMSLAEVALALRDEQLQAQITHYRADLQTSPELDAITAQVVAELQHLQARVTRAPSVPPPGVDRTQVEIDLIDTLKQQLSRLYRAGKLASVFERKLAEASKRFARLFFESELHERIRGSSYEVKTMRYAEQALFHVFTRTEQFLFQELASFEYSTPEVHARARELHASMMKELRNDYLARTTPELNALVKYLNEVLTIFLTTELPPMVGELSWQVVREARLRDAKLGASYKLSADGFPRFRKCFERRFLQLLVPFVEEEMLRRVRERQDNFRAETIRFVADPQIFSDVCELLCDATYDFLYNEGFLDLPGDWRVRLADKG